ncbi:type II toxin-antitoxin system ParD family antitoxin [Falsiroseomonas bella]|uniref:Type II toxin-antitoxin system ParD family antitoxin n=1 Tax=Falsiroseomonas bella TaxID=2184016 RepID=A0A317FCD0_9PROT|nr:type II toxin-antitoxin system ParD family antitoxin [Falsiroseomonas bella]PWS36751.1 type II toxin-antitoxin system ParD family antitoxin [Falsiroseomonas bella]
MATMTVSLPDEMKAWVEEQARSGRHANASDHVRDLIRRDQERVAFRQLIEDGMNSGVSDISSDEMLVEMRKRAATYHR